MLGEPLEREAEDEARSFRCGLLPGDGEARPDILSAFYCRKFDVGQLCCGAGEGGGLRQSVGGFSDAEIAEVCCYCAENAITKIAESKNL